jgi:hypothetical protein
MPVERAFYSIKEFCERNAISRATFYRRVPQDQLVKVGRRTLVPVACEKAWHASLNSSNLPSTNGYTVKREI